MGRNRGAGTAFISSDWRLYYWLKRKGGNYYLKKGKRLCKLIYQNNGDNVIFPLSFFLLFYDYFTNYNVQFS